jgi:hypothetical protein
MSKTTKRLRSLITAALNWKVNVQFSGKMIIMSLSEPLGYTV